MIGAFDPCIGSVISVVVLLDKFVGEYSHEQHKSLSFEIYNTLNFSVSKPNKLFSR